MKFITFLTPFLAVAATAQDFLDNPLAKQLRGDYARQATGKLSGVFTETQNGGQFIIPGGCSTAFTSMLCVFETDKTPFGTFNVYFNTGEEATNTTFTCKVSFVGLGAQCETKADTESVWWFVEDTGASKTDQYSGVFNCEYEAATTCFSEEATVHVHGKGSTTMKDLNVGDKILVGETYEPVYGFAHLDKSQNGRFLQIYTTEIVTRPPLEVSGDHLLLVNNDYVAAHTVKVGDILRGEGGGALPVTKIDTVIREGVYAPLTPSGKLLVNGIAVSSYAALPKTTELWQALSSWLPMSYHTANHMALSPIRMACLGVSSQFCSGNLTDQETGYPTFVHALLSILDKVDLSFLALVMIFTCGPLYLLESLVGATLAPTIIALSFVLLVPVGVALTRKNKGSTKKSRAAGKKFV